MIEKEIETGSDFSGVGAFDQALERLGIKQKKRFACDWDKYARQTYVANYGRPPYFPKDVYDREIPDSPLDIYMTSPPCQSFSNAGNRGGESDDRGVLFYNSHEFIKINQPRFFIFENVKGLLSDDKVTKKDEMGRTFRKWLDFLGGKSVNGNPIMFPHPECVNYHIYWKVLNARDHGIPQNRERVFIVGIRDDADNNFQWPRERPLVKRLKDVLEKDVPEKYFLSPKMLKYLLANTEIQKQSGNGFKFEPKTAESIGFAITTKEGSRMDDNFVLVKSGTAAGYEIATEQDAIDFGHLNSETRRGRVGKGVAQTLDTGCTQAVIDYQGGRMVGRNPDNPKSRQVGEHREQTIELNENPDVANTISTVQKDNVVVTQSPEIRIRRLTPRECFRLMGFPDTFNHSAVSDTQAFKQAGNSIVVDVLVDIISKLKL